MRATSPLPRETGDASVTVTARHMADAVGYLTRVAANAGLRGIAGKLTNVRTSLLKVVADGAEEDDPGESAAETDARPDTRATTGSGIPRRAGKADEDFRR